MEDTEKEIQYYWMIYVGDGDYKIKRNYNYVEKADEHICCWNSYTEDHQLCCSNCGKLKYSSLPKQHKHNFKEFARGYSMIDYRCECGQSKFEDIPKKQINEVECLHCNHIYSINKFKECPFCGYIIPVSREDDAKTLVECQEKDVSKSSEDIFLIVKDNYSDNNIVWKKWISKEDHEKIVKNIIDSHSQNKRPSNGLSRNVSKVLGEEIYVSSDSNSIPYISTKDICREEERLTELDTSLLWQEYSEKLWVEKSVFNELLKENEDLEYYAKTTEEANKYLIKDINKLQNQFNIERELHLKQDKNLFEAQKDIKELQKEINDWKIIKKDWEYKCKKQKEKFDKRVSAFRKDIESIKDNEGIILVPKNFIRELIERHFGVDKK